MSGSQTNAETGKSNFASGQFWGDLGKSLIPQGGGQMMGQGNQMAQMGQGNQTGMAPDCPDPNGIHGPGVKMIKSGYGESIWMCPVCAHRMPAGQQTSSFGDFFGSGDMPG